MIWIVILICVLANCYGINPNGDKLIHVQILFRHGDRNLIKSYANDPYKDKIHWKEGYGQLTNEGKKREYILGQFLSRRYQRCIQSYSADKVSILSSNFDRTINSANLVLAGLFPPLYDQVWNKHLLWQPIAVYALPLDRDVYIDNESACPRYLKAREEYDQSPEMLALVQSNQELFNYVETHAGQPVRTLDDFREIYEILELEYLLNKSLPEWTRSVFIPGGIADNLRTYEILTRTATPEMKRLKSGFLLKQILDRFLNKTLLLLPDEVMHIYSGHQITIASLLNTLGVFELHLPPYASCVMFELYESPEDHYIQLFYRNTTEENLTPIYIPNCGLKCSLHKYYELYGELLASDPETECAVGTNDMQYISYIDSGGYAISAPSILGYLILFFFSLELKLSTLCKI